MLYLNTCMKNTSKADCTYCKESFEYYPSQSHGKYCSNRCQRDHFSERCYDEKVALFERGELKNRKWIYRILSERANECSVCGVSEWNNKPLRLWVDHIDGDATNNSSSNFRLICPNCDSQSETFGARNIGNGRKSRGLPMYG